MSDGFLNNIQEQEIFKNKSAKIITSRKKIINKKKHRKCHSFEQKKEHFEIKLNISDIHIPLSESSIIYGSKEDFKNNIINENNNNMSFNIKKNNFNNDSIFSQESPKIKKKSSASIVNSSKKLDNLRKHFLKENKNEESIDAIQKDKTKIKRPNYLIKSCFYNNNDSTQKMYGRSLSKKEFSPSPVLDFYIYQDKNDYNNNGNILKKYYKHSTFGKTNNNNNKNNNLDCVMKKNGFENKIEDEKIKFESNYSFNKNKNHFLNDNEESFIKIIQADSSDEEKKDIKSFFGDKNDFANEINIINKIKDKEDTLSNLINESFKSQILEKQNNLNESIYNKHNNSISLQNISEGLSNSVYSNRSSLNEEFVFKNHSKIFQTNNNNNNNSQSNNNSINKIQEDKVNNENNLNKSDRQILSYFKNDVNVNNNQKYNNDSEEEFENKHYNININNNNNNNNNNYNEYEENNLNNINNKNYIQISQNENLNNRYMNQNNYINNNQNIYSNIINNNINYSNNNMINQFFPQINPNKINLNNINNKINYLQNINSYNNIQNNNVPNPYINNTINFIYNNNMNLFYNNPYSINNSEFNQQNINNNNFLINNNNTNYNYYPNSLNNFNFANPINQMMNKNLLNSFNNNLNNNINNNLSNNINNNINNKYFYQNNNNNLNNNINNNMIQKQKKYMNSNINNQRINKNNEKIKNYTKMSNEELAKNAYILAKTQDGSRFLEKIIDSNPSLVSNLFFPYTLAYFEELSNNKYGNFYIKKIIKNLSKELLAKLIEFLYPIIAKIATNQYGSKILEQLIKNIKDDDKLLLSFIQEIIPHMILLINDLNGTHIIYKLLLLKSKNIRLIEEHICNNIKSIYITREGSNLLKKYFEIINKEGNNTKNYEKIIFFINTINNNLSSIIIDQFGNYIIRHIVLNLNHSINNVILQNIIQNIVYYSNQKYSSNVVENCLDNNYIKDFILNELTKQYIFNNIFLNEYGNYVIQKSLSLADENKRDIYFKFIAQVTRQLQTLTFGPKLLSKLLMLYPKLQMYILGIYK